jgi:serine/threonine-protein phosphatase 2A regulatory subunit B''
LCTFQVPRLYHTCISFIFTFQRRSRSLLDNDELKKLYSVLEANSATPEDEFSSICEDNLMDYESFLKAKSLSSSKCQQYFKPMIFAKLQHGDPHGRISVMAFFNYVMRKVYCILFIWIHQHRKKYPFLYICNFFSK